MTVLDETVQIIWEYEEIQIAKGVTLGEKKETWNKKPAIHVDKLSSGEKQKKTLTLNLKNKKKRLMCKKSRLTMT